MSEGPKKRGRPGKADWINPHFTAKERAEIRATAEPLPGDENFESCDFGPYLDFRVAPPPWGEKERSHIDHSLLMMMVDPTSKNSIAHDRTCFARAAVAEYASEYDQCGMGQVLAQLFADRGADTARKVFADILTILEKRDQARRGEYHRNYYVLKAYFDFVEGQGFDPSPSGLQRFVLKNPVQYPIGTLGETWRNILHEVGLSMLANRRAD